MSNSRPFPDFLREHRGGLTHDELGDKLQELVAAVTAEGKGGSLTLTIKVSPSATGALDVSDEIKLVLPKETRSHSLFFATPDNNLVREDPRQTKMELRSITPATAHRGIA